MVGPTGTEIIDAHKSDSFLVYLDMIKLTNGSILMRVICLYKIHNNLIRINGRMSSIEGQLKRLIGYSNVDKTLIFLEFELLRVGDWCSFLGITWVVQKRDWVFIGTCSRFPPSQRRWWATNTGWSKSTHIAFRKRGWRGGRSMLSWKSMIYDMIHTPSYLFLFFVFDIWVRSWREHGHMSLRVPPITGPPFQHRRLVGPTPICWLNCSLGLFFYHS